MTREPNYYFNLARYSEWLTTSCQVPAEWRGWVEHRGSLTSALIEFSNNHFRVNVLSEHWARPYPLEALKLRQAQHLAARVREVELLCNEVVMVFARSIIPLAVFQKEPQTFQGMGSKPLGHLLFQSGRARNRQRSPRRWLTNQDRVIFGRSTPYEYHGGEILVSEFFVNPALISDLARQ